jgi:hypothetical protein
MGANNVGTLHVDKGVSLIDALLLNLAKQTSIFPQLYS